MFPNESIGKGMAICSLFYNAGLMVPTLIGLFLGPPDKAKEDIIFKLILLAPAILIAVNFLMFLLVFRDETPLFLLKQGRKK